MQVELYICQWRGEEGGVGYIRRFHCGTESRSNFWPYFMAGYGEAIGGCYGRHNGVIDGVF